MYLNICFFILFRILFFIFLTLENIERVDLITETPDDEIQLNGIPINIWHVRWLYW